jgi:murein L,D-transpeptidase YafK
MKGGKAAAMAAGMAALAAGLFFYFSPRLPAMPEAMTLDQPLQLPLQQPRVVVHKKSRELSLYDGSRLLRRYRVVLGANAAGDKEREGDKKTPEGTFYICTRNSASRFHKFMGLSYPGPADAERGLKAKQISRAEHDAILAAHRKKECPPWKTALGGEVGLHGGGIDRDWTLGCVALTNEAIDELWAALKMGDPVEIVP